MRDRIKYPMKPLAKQDFEFIHKLAKRAATKPFSRDFMTVCLDLEHCNCVLDWQRLLDADDFNFIHDISGINHCLDHETGEFKNCFIPRMAKRSTVQAETPSS